MSIVNKEELDKMMSKSEGKITFEVIDYAKKLLLEQLSKLINNEMELHNIKEKISNLKVELVSQEEFKRIYIENNGKGNLAGAFVIGDKIYFKNYSNDFHNLIHEMLHIISLNGDKHGFYQILREKKQYYGYGFNEAFTEYLTSIILEESFGGYSDDLNYMIQLFMLLTDLKVEDLLSLYISKKEWLSEEIIHKFNSTNEDLIRLVIEYDQRLLQSRQREFNPDNAIQLIINSIENKMFKNEKLKIEQITQLLKKYYNYFEDWNLSANIKKNISKILDELGTYINKQKI